MIVLNNYNSKETFLSHQCEIANGVWSTHPKYFLHLQTSRVRDPFHKFWSSYTWILKHNYTTQNKHQKWHNLNQDPTLVHLIFHKLPSSRDYKLVTHGVQNVKTNLFDYGNCKLLIVVLLFFPSILQIVAHNLKHYTFNFSMLLWAGTICTWNEKLRLEKQHYIKHKFCSSQTWH